MSTLKRSDSVQGGRKKRPRLDRAASSSALPAPSPTGAARGVRAVRAEVLVVSPTVVLRPGYLVVDARGYVKSVGSEVPPEWDAGDAVDGDAAGAAAGGAGGGSGREPTYPAPKQRATCIRAHTVVPGFVDMHVHGLGGADEVLDYWAEPRFTSSKLAQKGVTSYLATVVLPSADAEAARVRASFGALEMVIGKNFPGCACVEGVHAEGPCIATLGGLPKSDSDMSLETFSKLVASIPGLRTMTISPSLEASRAEPFDRLMHLCRRGVRPSLGHDQKATLEDIVGCLRAAASLGVRPHVTHLFNVTKFHHRDAGLTNVGLLGSWPALEAFSGVPLPTVELIGDMKHVSPVTVQLALASKPHQDIAFISDAIADQRPGKTINYSGRNVSVSDDATTVNVTGTNTMAGSCITLWETFQSLLGTFRVPLEEAVGMVSTNPAAIAQLEHIGSLQAGKRADFLLLSEDRRVLEGVCLAGSLNYERKSF